MQQYRILTRKFYCLLAAALGLLLFGSFFLTAEQRISRADESFYMAVAQRFFQGDRPLVDEWQNSQLSELFLVPFYAVFKAVTGGTEGIILFMRRVFVVVCLLFYGVFCRFLRHYGFWGVTAAAVFCALIPGAMLAINYYTMPPRLLMLMLFILFFGRKPCSKSAFFLSGVLLSLCVLFLPPLALLYVFFSIAVLVFEIAQKKRPAFGETYTFFFSRQNWVWLTLSVLACSAIFLTFLQYKSGLENVLACLPEVLSDPEHDFSFGGLFTSFWISKIPAVIHMFGLGNVLAAVMGCATLLLLQKRGKRKPSRVFWLCFSACLLVSFYAFPLTVLLTKGWNDWFYAAYVFGAVPFYFFGLINYLLCEQKDRRLFLIWLTGVLASLCMDFFSVPSFGFCAMLCVIPGFLCFAQILRELGEEKEALQAVIQEARKKKKSRTKRQLHLQTLKTKAVFLSISKAAFAVFLALTCIIVALEGFSNVKETEKLPNGAYRGIVTDADSLRLYEDILSDAEQIKAQSNGPIYVHCKHYNLFDTCFIFLHLDLPSANCSTWFSANNWDRQLRYFASHPKKQPDMLYFIVDDSDVPRLLEFIDLLCDGTVTKGVQGLIVKVNAWKDPVRPEIMDWVAQHGKEIV